MKPSKPAAFGRIASLVVGIALCVLVLAQGITKEIPYGGLEGAVVMRENGKPLPNATMILRPKHDLDWEQLEAMPEEDRPKSFVTETDEEGRFRFSSVPAGPYFLEASGKAHRIETVQMRIEEGKPASMNLELNPVAPYLDLYANQHVFTPDEEIKVQIHGFVEAEEVRFDAYRLDAASVVKGGTLRATLEPFSGGRIPEGARAAESFSRPIEGRDIEGTFRQFFDVPDLPEGLYWIVCAVGELKRGTYLNVTRMAMVTKAARGEMLAYVTDIQTGEPISGASVGVNVNGELRNGPVTDAGGIARVSLPSKDSGYVGTVAQLGESSAFVDVYQSSDEGDGQTRFFLYTERPIYRPGDEVHYKGIVRKLVGTDYAPPTNGLAELEIRDSGQTLVEKKSVAVSSMGTFVGSFVVNREAEPGSYEVKVTMGAAEASEYVTVAAYRKPEYSIKVTPEKPYYVRGERARMVIEAEYYFGAPVAGAEVSASIYREPYWAWWSEEDQEFEDYGGYGGEWIEEIKATTDSNGRAIVEFPTRFDDEWDDETDSVFSVNASVTDGDKYFDGQGKVKVVRGGFALSAESGSYVSDEGQPVEIDVKTSKHEGNAALPNVEVKLVSGYEVWTGMESVFRPAETKVVTTDAEGVAKATFTPSKSGTFVVNAEARDSNGNRIASQSYVWVYGGAVDVYGPTTGLDIKLDKKKYAVGDTMRALITSAKDGGSALLTIEGERVYDAMVVPLTGKVTAVEIPVTSAHRPNAYVSVAYVREKKFDSRSRRFGVDLGVKRLTIDIRADKPVYEPGAMATYELTTTNESGQPVSADLSLGIVDEAIYALAEDRTDIEEGFYPKRYNQVATSFSFEEIYLDGGDKAPEDIPIRTRFRDTAFWMPTVRTDSSGRATVRLQLPDNLTTWRATAVGATADTTVGQAVGKVVARKDLMIRLQTPAFFVQQDSQRLLAMVTNDTGRDAEVNVDLQVEGIKVEGQLKRTVSVPAGQTKPVEWTMSAQDAGEAKLVARAWAGSATDGMQALLEIQPHGRTFTDAWSGEVRASASVKVPVRPGAHPRFGSMSIEVAPSIASTLLQSLDELIGFPYGCVEQTMSRFMPTVVVAKALQDLKLSPPAASEQIPQMVSEGFARLKKMQHSDGGWGWWENDQSDAFMTALVLEGLYRAKRAGFEPNGFMTNRAVDWAKQEIPKPLGADTEWHRRNSASGRVYLLYALTLWGQADFVRDRLAANPVLPNNAYEAANLALTLANLGPGFVSKRDGALMTMLSHAQVRPDSVRWPEQYWGFETDARCVLALATIRPTDERLPRAVRSLVANRKGVMWYSTRDTSYVLVALTEYLRATKSLVQNAELRVLVNGSEVRRVAITPLSLFGPDLRVDVPMANLKPGENVVEFQKTGEGACFYSVRLRQNVVEDQLGPMTSTSGLSIERRFHALSAQRMEDGTLRLQTSPNAVTSASRGDVLKCLVEVTSDKPRQFAMIEVPIPSNCRVTERAELGLYEEWTWWFDKIVIRDDRVAFFAQDLPSGVSRFEFAFRAENPGVGHALPATVANMYDVSERASSAEASLEVRDK